MTSFIILNFDDQGRRPNNNSLAVAFFSTAEDALNRLYGGRLPSTDLFGYPVFYNYRHSIELALKASIEFTQYAVIEIEKARNQNYTPSQQPQFCRTHNLTRLYDELISHLNLATPVFNHLGNNTNAFNISLALELLDEFRHHHDILTQAGFLNDVNYIQNGDPHSDNYRYQTSRNTSTTPPRLDIEIVRRVYNSLIRYNFFLEEGLGLQI